MIFLTVNKDKIPRCLGTIKDTKNELIFQQKRRDFTNKNLFFVDMFFAIKFGGFGEYASA